VEPRHPLADREPIDLADRDVVTLFDLQKIVAKLLQVAGVIAERVRANIPLVLKMLEKLVERIVEHRWDTYLVKVAT
jgi:hypothetical protein